MALHQEFEEQGNFLFKYRSYFPILLIPVAFWVVFETLKIHPECFSLDALTHVEVLAIASCLLGLLIRIVTVGFTPKNTSGRNTESQLADTLNTTGIYSTVRHPLYLGNFFMWLGIAFLTANFWFIVTFVLAYYLYYERIMYAEEQFLTRKFGETYTKWAEVTPAFIPSFKNKRETKLTFSIKKVLKKEKNGLFAIFLLIFIFNCLVTYFLTESFMTHKTWSTYAMILTGIVYFILKFIKSGTTWLDEEGR